MSLPEALGASEESSDVPTGTESCLKSSTIGDDPETSDDLPVTVQLITTSVSPIPELPADLALHSPSANIVGTPFGDPTSTRFEYPFPADGASPAGSPHSTSPMSGLSPFMTPPQIPLLRASSPREFAANAYYSAPPLSTTYSTQHPLMRTTAEPPVPPGLSKKRHRWSLSLGTLGLGKRRGSDDSPGAASDSSANERSGGTLMLPAASSPKTATPRRKRMPSFRRSETSNSNSNPSTGNTNGSQAS